MSLEVSTLVIAPPLRHRLPKVFTFSSLRNIILDLAPDWVFERVWLLEDYFGALFFQVSLDVCSRNAGFSFVREDPFECLINS